MSLAARALKERRRGLVLRHLGPNKNATNTTIQIASSSADTADWTNGTGVANTLLLKVVVQNFKNQEEANLFN